MRNFLKIAGFILICELVGFLSASLSLVSFSSFYSGLVLPFFSPPSWLFGPVWTILYALMGVAVYLVYQDKKRKKYHKGALTLFAIQLFLNFLWSPIFFGYGALFLGLIEIIILLYFIVLTTMSFYKINKTAAYLLYPYLLWTSFASVLTFAIWLLNK